jgi:hypothetical protein
MMMWCTIREVGFVVIVSEVVFSVHSKNDNRVLAI